MSQVLRETASAALGLAVFLSFIAGVSMAAGHSYDAMFGAPNPSVCVDVDGTRIPANFYRNMGIYEHEQINWTGLRSRIVGQERMACREL